MSNQITTYSSNINSLHVISFYIFFIFLFYYLIENINICLQDKDNINAVS